MDTLTDILNDAEAINFRVRDLALNAYELDANVHCFPTVKALASARLVVTRAEKGMEMFRDGAAHATVAHEVGGAIADLL